LRLRITVRWRRRYTVHEKFLSYLAFCFIITIWRHQQHSAEVCDLLSAIRVYDIIMPPPLIGGALSDPFVWRLSVCLSVCLSVAYIGSKSRTERSIGRPNIDTDVAHVTRDSDTTSKVKRSKVKVARPLYSPPCWRVRQLHSSGRGNVLAVRNCCYVAVCSAARDTSASTEGGEVRGHIVAAARLQLALSNQRRCICLFRYIPLFRPMCYRIAALTECFLGGLLG